MQSSRRHFLSTALAAFAGSPRPAGAQSYPSRPVRIVVGAPPGSSPDVAARLMAQWLGGRFGQPFVVENRDGAAGSIAADAVVHLPADGQTLLLFSASAAINPAVYAKLRIDFVRDVAPVAPLVSFPNVITVNPSFPAHTLAEFIAHAKANPGKITIGTPGVGSPQYVGAALFKMATRTDIVVVPYRGTPAAVTDTLGGQIQGVIGTVLVVLDHVRAGKLRALAVTGAARCELMPEVPAVNELVPGFEATQWVGLGAPKGTPAEILDRLNGAVNAGLADPTVRARLVALGGTVLASSRVQFAEFIGAEADKWAKVVKFAGYSAD